MNRVTKRMATNAVIVMFAVIIAVGITFISVQTEKLDSLFAQNIEALAQNENPTVFYISTCYWQGKLDPAFFSQCNPLTTSSTYYKCTYQFRPTTNSDTGSCLSGTN